MNKFVIKSNSWHWKVYSLFHYGYPTNFCSYFWKVLVSLIVLLCTFILCALFAVMVISAPFYVFGISIPYVSDQIATIGILIYFTAFMCFLLWAAKKTFEKILSINSKRPLKEKTDGLFVTKVKSMKNKICPLIEVDYK